VSDVLQFARDGFVAILTLDRPKALNAFDPELHLALMDALGEIRDDDAIRSVVVTGAGRAFCSGVDLTKPFPDPAAQADRMDRMQWFGRQALALATLDKPTIAAVNGIAAGMGMSTALQCDLRVGGAKARFRTIFVERCMSPDTGLSWLLPRVIGYSRAADLVMTSRDVDADEAYRLGLLDRLVPDDDPLGAAVDLANQVNRWPPTAIRTAKRVLQHSLVADFEDALLHESMGLDSALSAKNDAREARQSFIERRDPNFTGT
jgi:2-(1,2-epoxy-1,2-dihydrophenyl)acetyl-CoA isomerase